MNDTTPARDLTRTFLAVLCLGALITASLLILRPFIAPLIWAALLVIATWPALRKVEARLGARRGAAVAVMMSLVLLCFVLPLLLIFGVLVERAPDVADWLRQLVRNGLPPPPSWVASLPAVGTRIATAWSELSAAGPEGLAARLTPHVETLAAWFVAQVGGLGLLLLHFLLTMLLTGLLFAKGDAFAQQVQHFAWRLAGERGEKAAVLAARSVRAVAFGVVVTALIQSAAGGIGLLIAGVPAPGLLTAFMFIASIVQIGAAPVVFLAAMWMFWQGGSGWGIALIVWAVLVGSMDNVIRPLLIRRGVELPLVLVFAGVIGGLVAFGPVGLFAGPVVLAVAHTLLAAWLTDGVAPQAGTVATPAS